jgi:GntR family transcriptional repressor for pyruvate dehydrogenase complex
MGLVRVEPRLGVFVQDPDAGTAADKPASSSEGTLEQALAQALSRETHNVFHLIDARLAVETELVGKAARAGHAEALLPLRGALESVLGDVEDRSGFIAADEAFHLEMARLAGNPVLLAFLRTLLERLRSDKQGVLLSAENRQRTDREHVELYRSILEGRPEKAQAVLREHIDYGRALLLEQLRTVPAVPTVQSPKRKTKSRATRAS